MTTITIERVQHSGMIKLRSDDHGTWRYMGMPLTACKRHYRRTFNIKRATYIEL